MNLPKKTKHLKATIQRNLVAEKEVKGAIGLSLIRVCIYFYNAPLMMVVHLV